MTAETAYGPLPERDLRRDLLDVITRTALAHPRSQQRRIGPSEIGTPCLRKLAYKLSETPEVGPPVVKWRTTVGTAVHAWLQSAFDRENRSLGWDRWVTEMKVTGGVLGGVAIDGHADLYDLLTSTVIDWKIPGKAGLQRARNYAVSATYRAQTHCYGYGFVQAGFEVNHVAIMFLPASGELGEHHYWTEPYDQTIALGAFARANALLTSIDTLGPDLLPLLPMTDDYCRHCEWWNPKSHDVRNGCPGLADQTPVTPPRDIPSWVTERNPA